MESIGEAEALVPLPANTSGPSQTSSGVASDGIAVRAKANRSALVQVLAGPEANRMPPVDLHEWVAADISEFFILPGEIAHARLDTIAANLEFPEYASALQYIDPGFASRVRAHADLLLASDFILANANVTKDVLVEQLAKAPAQLTALLSDSTRLSQIDLQIARRLHWLSAVHLNDVHATIAATFGRDDAADRIKRADATRLAAARGLGSFAEADPGLREKQIQEVADFVAANRGVLSWKVRENIAKSPAQDLLFRQLSKSSFANAFEPASPERPVTPVKHNIHTTSQSAPSAAIAPAPQPRRQDRNPSAEAGDSNSVTSPIRSKNSNTNSAVPEGTEIDRQAQGYVVRHGAAPYEHKQQNSMSYFVELESPNGERRTVWGLDLERATALAGLRPGDYRCAFART